MHCSISRVRRSRRVNEEQQVSLRLSDTSLARYRFQSDLLYIFAHRNRMSLIEE
jgi:hypothetical protein